MSEKPYSGLDHQLIDKAFHEAQKLLEADKVLRESPKLQEIIDGGYRLRETRVTCPMCGGHGYSAGEGRGGLRTVYWCHDADCRVMSFSS